MGDSGEGGGGGAPRPAADGELLGPETVDLGGGDRLVVTPHDIAAIGRVRPGEDLSAVHRRLAELLRREAGARGREVEHIDVARMSADQMWLTADYVDDWTGEPA
ncbi:MAG TPA: hypothetical protein VFS29_05605 [Motilibacteraceae bacterium]|nr:hypothetical protein [Motilibacteraceae bacterium]